MTTELVTAEGLHQALTQHGFSVHSTSGRFRSKCPICLGSRNDSLSFEQDHDKLLVHCHEGGCALPDVLSTVGLMDSSVTKTQRTAKAHTSRTRSRRVEEVDRSPACFPSAEEAARAAKHDLKRNHQLENENPTLWIYHNDQNEPVGGLIRFDLADEVDPKTYRSLKANDNATWSLQGMEKPHPLYRLPEVVEADEVWIFEGEKCADLGASLGLTTTTSLGGCGAASKTDWSTVSGKRVVICGDEGERGQRYVDAVIRILKDLRIPPKQISQCQLPLTGDNDDIEQWLLEYHDANDDVAAIVADLRRHTRPIERDLGLTEQANSNRFIDQFGDSVRYCAIHKSWYVWDGKRWREDATGATRQMAKDAMAQLYEAAVHQLKMGDGNGDELLRFAKASNSRHGIDNALSLAKVDPRIAVEPSDFDKDPWLLNVRNGTVDLRTRTLLKHRKADLLRKIAGVEFDESATCPGFDRFLGEIIPDTEVRAFVQRACGLMLLGEVLEHAIFVLHGVGANGKSTFLNLLLTLLGNYGMVAPTSILLRSRADRVKYAIAECDGKRLVVTDEVDLGATLDESLIKQLTSPGQIPAERKYGQPFGFENQMTLVMAVNHRPKIRGQDDGIWRRVKLVPFTQSIPPEDQDPLLTEKLEQELAGILNWLLAGLDQYRAFGLNPPDAVQAATQQYREDEDQLADFVEAKCIVEAGAAVGVQELFNSYVAYCDSTAQKPMGRNYFAAAMEERGYDRKRASRGKRFQGIRIA